MSGLTNVPRNVFRVCPETTSTAPSRSVPSDEYTIRKMSDGEVLRVCKGQITMDDLLKAAKCAKLKTIRAYKYSTGTGSGMLKSTDFPIKKDVYITQAKKSRKKSTRTQVFHVCESTSVPPVRTPVRTPAPTRNTIPPQNEFMIIQASNANVLRVCEGRITKDDLDKAAKCAGYQSYRVYKRSNMVNCELTVDDLPVAMNVYISKFVETPGNRTKIFSVCESTSVPPTRTQVSATPSATNSMKKGLLDKAIKCFKDGITALESLSRNL